MSSPNTKKTKTALILSGDEGHLSIAQAVQEILEGAGWQTHLHSTSTNIFASYKPFYLFFPSLFKIPFHLTQHQKVKVALEKLSTLKFQQPVYSLVNQVKPDLIIVTWLMYIPIVDAIKKVSPIPILNIVPDPRTFHPLALSHEADFNLMFDQTTVKQALHFGLNPTKLVASGWFTQKKFKPAHNQTTLRHKLGLKPDLLTFLVTGGSEGTNLISKISPAFLQSTKPVQVVINVGHNQLLPKLVKSINTLSKYYPKAQATLITLPYTKNLYQYMQASDLVIGKAGPNTLFESIATHTPFFAITHIAGQEDGNLDLIREQQLGFVEESPLQAIKLVRDLINHPQKLESFADPIHRLASFNAGTPDRFLHLINRL